MRIVKLCYLPERAGNAVAQNMLKTISIEPIQSRLTKRIRRPIRPLAIVRPRPFDRFHLLTHRNVLLVVLIQMHSFMNIAILSIVRTIQDPLIPKRT